MRSRRYSLVATGVLVRKPKMPGLVGRPLQRRSQRDCDANRQPSCLEQRRRCGVYPYQNWWIGQIALLDPGSSHRRFAAFARSRVKVRKAHQSSYPRKRSEFTLCPQLRHPITTQRTSGLDFSRITHGERPLWGNLAAMPRNYRVLDR